MRTRSRVEEGVQILRCVNQVLGYTANVYSSYNPELFGGNIGPRYYSKSDMEDYVTPGNARYGFNNCVHTKSVGVTIKGTMRSYQRLYGLYSPEWITYDFNWPMTWNPELQVTAPWNSMVDELAALAEGSTSNNAMLPVTLLEGAKTIAMCRNPFNLLKPKFRRQVRKLTARTLAASGANVWLEGYYGWKSFYQDTETIAKATAQFLYDDHQKYLEKLGERLTVKSSVPVSNGYSYTLGTAPDTWNGPNPHKQGLALRCSNVNGYDLAVLGCKQFQNVADRMDRTKRFLNLYGLTPNWRTIRDTIWEVIPFSFVVDWFVDTRGLWAPLNKWRLGQMDIRDIGYSTRSFRSYRIEAKPMTNPFYYSPYPWSLYFPDFADNVVFSSEGSGTHSVYRRYSGFPSEPAAVVSFNTKGLSFIRSVNGIALIAQLLAGKKR